MPIYKTYDFECACGHRTDDQLVEPGEIIKCEKCFKPMQKLVSAPRMDGHADGTFRPFYSDTFEMHVRDREDMNKVRALRKQHGLEVVGHDRMRPDRKAIRHNFEN